MEIIIGREEGARRLHCTLDGKDFYVGQAGSVPSSVSRQHCKIIVDGTKMSIVNLKYQNITYVNGNQVMSKEITMDDSVQLGEGKYIVPLKQILNLIGKGKKEETQQPTFSLVPMKSVWEEYDKRKMDIQNNAAKMANRQRLQGIASMLGMCLGFIDGLGSLRYVVMVVALLLAIYFFYKGSKNATVQQQLHDLDEEYATKYKCPNPACGRPFGNIPYRNIEHNKQCISCGCKYTH